ncbi:hypothetical protein SASPL_148529 [Salvia splendens]|uniref:FH2 domain-containing protein n=1 Tax=Salvia splendens TaxID=180675 RepID=A0A8X8WAF5_SALSN|nr:hypothetical protein SASPL_148529 [Salvia splendens]
MKSEKSTRKKRSLRQPRRKSDVSANAFNESAFFLCRCCCVWTFPCYGTPKPKNLERISPSETEHHDGDRSWTDGVEAFKKVREWSELVAGPKWKTFIRRFNKAFLEEGERKLRELQGDEDRVLRLVREITKYFHGDVSKDESNPLRIFVIVKDFLSMLDNVCNTHTYKPPKIERRKFVLKGIKPHFHKSCDPTHY